MDNRLKQFIFILFFITLMKADGAAENLSAGDNIFDDIKAQMISSVEENKKLLEENKTLKTELISLQLEIERYEQDIAEIDPEYMKSRELSSGQNRRSAGWSDPEDDDLIREAQNIYLSGRSMLLDDLQRLKELHLYDLQYQKQELELDLKSMEFLYQKVSEQRRPELEALEREIEGTVAKTRDVSMRIAQEEKAALAYPREMDLLKMENNSLKQRISQFKRLLK